MIGTSRRREHGLKDPLLVEVMETMGLDRVPLYDSRSPAQVERKRRIEEMGRRRDGPVGTEPAKVADPAAMASEIKDRARALGADLVGIAELRPVMIDLGADLPEGNIICIGVHEDYRKVLGEPRAVEEEAHKAYYEVARIATELAAYIREVLGHPARAHHNGGTEIQAIPAMYHAGFGELGKHGSLINPEFGASFRPSFVTTNLPLAPDRPREFGVQDRCLTCNVCTNNCPGDAIPSDYILTEGIRRWLTDIARCYPYSRLREEYCHLCVDVCPYNAPIDRDTYKAFMKGRKADGYKAPKRS